MRFGERTHAVQGADHRDAAAGGELQQLLGGAGDVNAVAGHDDRALGRVDDLGGLADHAGVADLGGPVAAQVHLVGRGLGGGFQEHVLGNVHVDRARAAGGGQVEGFRHHARQVVHVHDQVAVLGDGNGNAGDVGFLEGVGADGRPGHLAGDVDHAHRVHDVVGHAGDHVGGARPGGAGGHADLAGGPRVAVGGEAGGLLVPDQHVPDAVLVVVEGVVERQRGAAGHPEDDVDAGGEHGVADHLAAGTGRAGRGGGTVGGLAVGRGHVVGLLESRRKRCRRVCWGNAETAARRRLRRVPRPRRSERAQRHACACCVSSLRVLRVGRLSGNKKPVPHRDGL